MAGEATVSLGTARVIRADSRNLPLDDNSVDLVITSPPYFALRSYQDGGVHYSGQIGDEPTPAEFVDSLLEVTRECVRVLKPSGSLWVNLGDKYATRSSSVRSAGRAGFDDADRFITPNRTGIRDKSLIGIPWRYALRCIDDLGLILRAEVIWSKPNGLPESVTDRVRRSHEQWFHFVLNPRYYSAVDEIREPTGDYRGASWADRKAAGIPSRAGQQTTGSMGTVLAANPLGKLPGSVWDIGAGNTLVRTILDAVAAGALTPEEGERLWTSASDSYGTLMTPATAGNGSDGKTRAATERPRPTSSRGQRTGRTESPTDSSSDRSLTDSRSTTPVGTSDASTPHTSSRSPEPRTSDEPTPSATPVPKVTHSQTPTASAPVTGRSPSVAGPATSPESTPADSVWRVPTEPLRVPEHLGVDHFAAFPTELPKRIIQGWSPAGVCVECGDGRRPVVLRGEYDPALLARRGMATGDGRALRGINTNHVNLSGPEKAAHRSPDTITGYACACPEPTAPTTPAVVLDPFGGTGTTAMVAKALGRDGISVDMSADYCRLAEWRTSDRDQLAKVLGIEKADPVHPDETSLFDLLDGGAA